MTGNECEKPFCELIEPTIIPNDDMIMSESFSPQHLTLNSQSDHPSSFEPQRYEIPTIA